VPIPQFASSSRGHAKGFVHRDIKPANLLIEDRGNTKVVKVGDFELARVTEASQLSGLTLNEDVGGTYAFMPPERSRTTAM